MWLWDELTGKADKERAESLAGWKASAEEQAVRREAAIPQGYEWVWRAWADNPMRFPACSVCGATVEIKNAERHDAWHAQIHPRR